MMRCTRFEDEGLMALEQGLPLDEHFNTCVVCIEEQRKYEALKVKLKTLPAQSALPSNWQQKVLEQVSAHKIPSKVPSRNHWYLSLAASIATIGIASILFLKTPDEPVLIKGIEQYIVSGTETYRGENAKVGDQINIIAYAPKSYYMQIRVYRNGRPYFSCGLEKACVYIESKNAFSAQIELGAIGEYQSVLIQSLQQVEVANKNLDIDVLNARTLEATVLLGKPVTVN